MADTPLTPEEERVARAWIDAAAREVDFVRGGIFDIAARAFATLDAERARQPAPSEGLTPTGRWFRATYGSRGYVTADDLKAKVRQLAHLTPEDWQERRGADPIARTINAVFDIIDEYSAVQPAPSEGLRAAIEAALLELGVPDEDYPAPVANAVTILRDALARQPAPSEGPET